MSRSKKSRKINANGPRLQAKVKGKSAPESKKKGRGLKAGSRVSSAAKSTATQKTAGALSDPMHGSKKPVSLVASKPITQSKLPLQERLNETPPETRLIQLENDPRLNRLLDKVDAGAKLSTLDRKWMNEQLDIIAALMDQLGIEVDDEEPQNPSLSDEDRMLSEFDSGLDALNQFREDKHE
ncbi:Der GTPase-activating protein YihI [Paraferrimonas haliotis]|uniref:Der GTPase-activating protein YihI n=1 Tax=Paraferrimonas haliotis TaxID=2013866 RepID=A0AA37WY41_9GAMM|nr:Der GTPase-activating protein YihI [Paraferrimonas haliotis]GLS85008.1 Der GTPase-activating protein YihI [Paraferrimonas haliotis]